MELRKSYKFEIDPNDVTRTLLFKHAGVARFAYNWSLARRIERFNTQEGKEKFTSAMAEHKALNALKGSVFPWMYEVSKCAPQGGLRNVDRAFKNFWARRKEGVGFPKFKKKYKSRDSFRLDGQISLQDRYVKLPRLGVIRVKEKGYSKRIEGEILSATVSRTADRWFVSINTVREVEEPEVIDGPQVGVDLGIKTFAVISDGKGRIEKVYAPHPLKKATKRLRRAQRQHSKKVRGSKNTRKSSIRIAKIHARVANIRRDFLHKTTTRLTKTKAVIVVENLNVKGMMQNHCLAKALSDQAFGEFYRQLGYKTPWYGSVRFTADRWFPSSKICFVCKCKNKKLTLSDREWMCSHCGSVLDRDENAANNLATYPEFTGEFTPVEISGGGTPIERCAVYESRVAKAGTEPVRTQHAGSYWLGER